MARTWVGESEALWVRGPDGVVALINAVAAVPSGNTLKTARERSRSRPAGRGPARPARCLLCCELVSDNPPGVNLDDEKVLVEGEAPLLTGRYVHRSPCFAIHKLAQYARAPGRWTYECAPFCPPRAVEKLTEVLELLRKDVRGESCEACKRVDKAESATEPDSAYCARHGRGAKTDGRRGQAYGRSEGGRAGWSRPFGGGSAERSPPSSQAPTVAGPGLTPTPATGSHRQGLPAAFGPSNEGTNFGGFLGPEGREPAFEGASGGWGSPFGLPTPREGGASDSGVSGSGSGLSTKG